MVTGGTGWLRVPSPVICAITRHGRLLLVGRGAWWSFRTASTFLCALDFNPSGLRTGYWARVVTMGLIAQLLVHSAVILPIILGDLELALGRLLVVTGGTGGLFGYSTVV